MKTTISKPLTQAYAIIENNLDAQTLTMIKTLNFHEVIFYKPNSSILDLYHLLESSDSFNNQKDSVYCFTLRKTWTELNKKINFAYYMNENLDLSKQEAYIKESLKNQSQNPQEGLLNLVNQAKRFKHSDDLGSVPLNGIYLLFENGENKNDLDRVVRVGTHTGNNLLPARLKQHYEIENKDRSIFRTNLGRALLHHENDPYLEVWSRNNTTRIIRAINLPYRNLEKELLLERDISAIIQSQFSFALISVDDKEYRLYLETALIASFAFSTIRPSQNWLGLKSPVLKIRESGLWQVQGIMRRPINAYDLAYIKDHLVFF